MAVIYTVSHPFTNEIVYVGCTKYLTARIRAHFSCKNGTPISNWIQELNSNYILPKIEQIDTCDSDEGMYFELYWIHQLKAWGFNLLNNNKMPKLKSYYVPVKKRKNARVQRKPRIKSAKKWSIESFELGNMFTVDYNKRNSFRTMLCDYAHRFKIERSFKSERIGDKIIYTVILKEEKVKKPTYGVTKSGITRYRPIQPKKEKVAKQPKITRYNFKSVQIGDTLEVPLERYESFKNSLKQYNDNNNANIRVKWEPNLEGNKMIFTYIDPSEKRPRITINQELWLRIRKKQPLTP